MEVTISKFTGKRFWREAEEPQLSFDLDLPLHIAKIGVSPKQRRQKAEDLLIELAAFLGEVRADVDFDEIVQKSRANHDD
jgi:hypothetical protein